MLKLSLSATETQYLSEKTDQNPYSPLSPLNKAIDNPYSALPESEQGGEKKKRGLNKGNFRPRKNNGLTVTEL